MRADKYRSDVSDFDEANEDVRTVDGAKVETSTINDSIMVTSDQNVARIINQARVAAGIGVHQRVHEQRGLEDVYIELTGVSAGSPLSAPAGAAPPPAPVGVGS